MTRPQSISRARQSLAKDRFHRHAPLIALGLVLFVAVSLGGGGMRYALANLAVQLVALIVLAIRSESVFAFLREAPTALRSLVGLTILLPVLQLAPLPEALWSALPGRDLVQQSFALIGKSGWAPASVDPIRTLVALTGLIVPLTMLTAGWTLSRQHLVWLGWLLVVFALGNFLVGVTQVLPGGTASIFFSDRGGPSLLLGTFANRNSTGLFFAGAIAFAAWLPAPRSHPAVLPVRIAICSLLVVGVVLTRSRTALVLSAIPLVLIAARAVKIELQSRAERSDQPRFRRSWIPGAIGLALAIGSAVIVVAPGRVGDTIERFGATADARQYIWEDAAYSASRYWPVGAGMGSFDEVFQVDESLENATPRRAGRAHNDYLEVAIEAGIPGLVLIALWLAIIAWFVWRARYSDMRWSAWAAATLLLLIALQSITDYPLRNQAMLAIAGGALLLLARIAASDEEAET